MPRSFDDIYPSKGEYDRFHLENTAFQRVLSTGERSYSNIDKKVEKMRQGIPGFSLIDYSFSDAALTVALASHSGRGNMNQGFYSWKPLGATVKPEEIPRWEGTQKEAATVIRKAGLYYGAADIGFCELDRRWVYSHTTDDRPIVFEEVEEGYVTDEKVVIPDSHRWVIAITVPMEVEEVMYAPTALTPVARMGYSRMPIVAGSLAEFIRGLGYHAIPSGNDTAISVPIAIQAGLGHVGRHGRLITWNEGPMVRIAKIFTDMPLAPSPMTPEGIIEYCEVCEKCAKHCPSQSIPLGPRTYEGFTEANNPGVLRWFCNADTCYEYWREIGTGCSVCFRVCSFTKERGVSHSIIKWFIRNVPQLNRFFVWSDDVLGYGKMKDPKEYWKE